MAIAIYLGTTLAVTIMGGEFLHAVRLRVTDRSVALLVGFVVGHGIAALAILALGLAGYANWWALAELMLLIAWSGLRRLDTLVPAALELGRRGWRGLRSSRYAWAYRVTTAVVLLQLVAALAPATDYDGLAEHLAQAQQYVMAGRIIPLWYDHHAHFPATLQMFYLLAHALNAAQAAKLYHWGFGVVALLATLVAGRRLFGRAAGAYGAMVLATTPTFAWLMGVAYVDLATTACSIVAVLLLCLWLRDRDHRYLVMSALAMGVGAGSKMQALALLGVLVVVVAAATVGWRQRLRAGALYLVLALSLCLPWYLKSWIWTGNPVYPFAYGVFGGKMWSADRAAAYRHTQLQFGVGEMPPADQWQQMSELRRMFVGPRAPLNLVLAPLHLLLRPHEFTVGPGPLGAFACDSPGPMYLALLLPMLLLPRPRPVGWLMLIFAPLWVWWLFSVQLTRYLLPSLALIAPAIGWAATEAEARGGVMRAATKVITTLWPPVALVLMAMYVVPQAPPVLGLQPASEYLARVCEVYPPTHYLAEHAPSDAVVALYGEPRGYYLQRRHLWAEPGHSALIDYERVRAPEDLIAEFRRLGITHVVTRAPYFPALWGSGDRLAELMGAAVGRGLLTVLWDAPGREKGYLVLQVAN